MIKRKIQIIYKLILIYKGGGAMNCPDYTINKKYPLMVEQNEMVDFAIKRPYAIISGQT